MAFPYVGGELFTATSFIPKFNFTIRQKLIDFGRIEWDQISPAIFGSMFQYALDPDEQQQEGAHYTSEQNILKLIKPLFLDDLTQQVEAFENEFQAINAAESMGAEQAQAGNKTFKSVKKVATDKLNDLEQRAAVFLEKLGHIRIMDPACGCGNFLIVAYRELRRLENRVLKLLYRETTLMQDIVNSKVTIDHFYGIEIEDWPTEIAQLSMWLMQHQVNRETEQLFGTAPASLPLSTAAHIHCINALTTDWNEVLPAGECSYLVGNPPFGGTGTTSSEQKAWLKALYPDKYPIGGVDFVSGWFIKAAEFMLLNKDCHAAFVSTNSICQGEQVNTLWGLLMKQVIVINFAYTSFRWNNEAVNAAKVFCVIVGFSYQSPKSALLFREQPDGSFEADEVRAISPYLMDEPTCTIVKSQNTALIYRELL